MGIAAHVTVGITWNQVRDTIGINEGLTTVGHCGVMGSAFQAKTGIKQGQNTIVLHSAHENVVREAVHPLVGDLQARAGVGASVSVVAVARLQREGGGADEMISSTIPGAPQDIVVKGNWDLQSSRVEGNGTIVDVEIKLVVGEGADNSASWVATGGCVAIGHRTQTRAQNIGGLARVCPMGNSYNVVELKPTGGVL
jgi:hypothetical protein